MLCGKIILDIFVTGTESLILTKDLRHTISHIIVAAALFLYGSTSALSQELQSPQRWMNELHTVIPLFRPDTVTIRFLGDIMMHGKQIENAHRGGSSYDFSSYFKLIKDKLAEADLTVANMEFALGGEPYSGYPAFSAPDEIATYAAGCGIDIFLAANNHIYDKGMSGAERTLDIYRELHDSHGIMFTGLASDPTEEGCNNPLMTAVKGIRLAFINMTYATNGGRRKGWPKVNYLDNKEDMLLAINTAQGKYADIIIALPHWGNEYELRHSAEQENTARWLSDKGVDLIIGAHPHVVQDSTTIRNVKECRFTPTVYSLGNAVSNMSAKNTQLELMATVRIVRNTDGKVRQLPVELTFLWCSRPGGFNDSYTVIPVEEYLDKAYLWTGEWDHSNMVSTYERVKNTTGIK